MNSALDAGRLERWQALGDESNRQACHKRTGICMGEQPYMAKWDRMSHPYLYCIGVRFLTFRPLTFGPDKSFVAGLPCAL